MLFILFSCGFLITFTYTSCLVQKHTVVDNTIVTVIIKYPENEENLIKAINEIYQSITPENRELLEKKEILFPNQKYIIPEPFIYKNIKLPPLYIRDGFITDPILLYKCSCFLINSLKLGIEFKIPDYEKFVKDNKSLLINLISIFYEKDKGCICFQYPSNAGYLFQNKDLEPEITELKEKLKKENKYIDYP